MNLVIEFDERILASIAESGVKRLLQFSDYSSGSAAKYVETQTQDALNEVLRGIDFTQMIKELAVLYSKGIVEEVVKEELKKVARQSVKELKARGELL